MMIPVIRGLIDRRMLVNYFNVDESDCRYRIIINSDDRKTHVAVEAEIAGALPASSVFRSLDQASAFFETGALGFSPAGANELHALELRSFGWKVEPLRVTKVESSFFEDETIFPPDSVEFDCALLMRGIAHEWHAHESLKVA